MKNATKEYKMCCSVKDSGPAHLTLSARINSCPHLFHYSPVNSMPATRFAKAVFTAVCLTSFAIAAPAGTSVVSASESSPTAPYASENANRVLWTEYDPAAPQPIRDTLGASILGPQNVVVDLQNPDLLAPPSTDAGTV